MVFARVLTAYVHAYCWAIDAQDHRLNQYKICRKIRFAECTGRTFLEDGRPVETRTPALYRVNVAALSFTVTYKTAGTAKIRGSRGRQPTLWVELWAEKNSHC